jgi:hypothetical protein
MTEYPPLRRREAAIKGSPYLIISSCCDVCFINLVCRAVFGGRFFFSGYAAEVTPPPAFCPMIAPPSFSQRQIQRFISRGQCCSLAGRLSAAVTRRLVLLLEREGRSGNAIRLEEGG